MDGWTLLRGLREKLNESSDSTFLDTRTSYDCLYEAAKELTYRTRALTATQSITTVADTTTYNLNPDYMGLWMQDDYNRFFVKYNDGTSDTFLRHKDYDAIYLANNTTSQSIPNKFTVTDKSSIASLSGTTTSAGTASNGEATLTDTSADFTDVAVGDYVHNTTDGSHGVIVSKTSNTVLVCALFDGTNDDWTSGDSYIITFNGRFSLILDPPPSTSSHTVTVPYIQMPEPVYSPYRSYRFAPDYKEALLYYAAFKYKYRDSEPNFGDAFFKHYDMRVRAATRNVRGAVKKGGFRVNMVKTASRSGSTR